jgi:hypothetical protein
MNDGLDQQLQARDHRGRWQRGTTGNPAGRPRGSRNRWRRADPARALLWKRSEWRLHFDRIMRTAQGDPEERAALAYGACQNLWRAHHPPRAKRGTCPQCGRPLSPPNPSFDAAAIPIDNAFVHHNCVCQFARDGRFIASELLVRKLCATLLSALGQAAFGRTLLKALFYRVLKS